MIHLNELLERVKDASGVDMLLSDDIWRAVRGQKSGSILYHETPDLTESIDNALAFVEKMLPGWNWCVGHDADAEINAVVWHGVDEANEYGATPALAIIAALLTALIAQDEK